MTETKTNSKKLKILVAEDSVDDYELIINKIKKDGFEIESARVETSEEFTLALAEKNWDIILSDNSLPKFDATQALGITRRVLPYIPFIIVSGTIGEDIAVNAMKAGANDYILKDNLSRLVPAINRELRDSESQIQKLKTEEALKKSLQNYQYLAENVQDLVSVHDNKGDFAWISPSARKILGWSTEELMSQKAFAQIHPEDYERVVTNTFKKMLSGDKRGMQRFTYRYMRKDGVYIYLEALAEPVYENAKLKRIVRTARDITEQVLATQLLEENQAMYESVLESLSEGILLVDNSNRVKTFNHSVSTILGINISINDSLTNIFDDSIRLVDTHYKSIETKAFFQFAMEHCERVIFNKVIGLKKDDNLRWLSLNVVPYTLNDEILGSVLSFSDITELFNNEEKANQIAAELVTLIETANAPIFGTDREGNITEWNSYTSQITGYSKQETENENIFDKLILKGEIKNVKGLFERVMLGEKITHYELPIITKTGKVVTILFNATIRKDFNNNIIGMICVGQDITELIEYRNQLENKVNERTLKLNEALQNEKELVKLKSKFVSMASHEFRTPLSSIKFASDFIRKYHDRTDWDNLLAKLDNIDEQIKHMSYLLDDVLIMGKSDAGKIKINKAPVDIRAFCTKIKGEVEYMFNNSHSIESLINSDTKHISSDEKLLRNILINLLSNAIKFSPNKNKVGLTVTCSKNYMQIQVEDWGLGVDEEEVEQIFEAFHRSKRVTNIDGTGLGLSIAKKAVELLGGTIKLFSELGKGTTFVVNFPVTYDNSDIISNE
ncbi:MAG TPA: PAS domain S-box protein [Fulvivirga sp.]|nr:PAS domain S-box protein [Fulvivirga sp.]